MSTPDSFLVAWWLLTGALGVIWFLFAKWLGIVNQQTAASIALRGDRPGPSGTAIAAMAVLRTIAIVAGVLIVVWLAGLIAFTWMSHWTNLLFMNFRLFAVLFGASCVGAGLFASANVLAAGYPALFPPWLMRPLMVPFGLICIAMGSHQIVGDLASPKLIVEGQVSSVSHSWSKGDKYSIVIDGKRLRDAARCFPDGERG
jgi:hypothetical protein